MIHLLGIIGLYIVSFDDLPCTGTCMYNVYNCCAMGLIAFVVQKK